MSNKDTYKDTEESSSSDSGSRGDAAGVFIPDQDVWQPSFYELNQLTKQEDAKRTLAEEILHEVRVGVRSKKYEVVALTKAQKFLHKKSNSLSNDSGGGGINLESHPELEDMGGKVDPNHVVLPECEVEAQSALSNDPQLQYKLKQKLAKKFGMGNIGSMSKEALEMEHKKKMRNRVEHKPKQQPRFRAQPTPRNTMG